MPAGTAVVGPLDRAIAAELRALIGRRGLQDKDVAAEAGIPTSTFSKLVRRPTTPMRVNQLAGICTVLGVEPADVMTAAVATQRRHPDWFAGDEPLDPDVQAGIDALQLSDAERHSVETAARAEQAEAAARRQMGDVTPVVTEHTREA